MAVGLARVESIFYSAAAGVGNPIVYLGSKTGRDGIHGATFSSAELTTESEKVSGGAVQIGNAITEKMVLDVLLAGAVRVDGDWNAALASAEAHPDLVVVTDQGDRFGRHGWRVGSSSTGVTGATVANGGRKTLDHAVKTVTRRVGGNTPWARSSTG